MAEFIETFWSYLGMLLLCFLGAANLRVSVKWEDNYTGELSAFGRYAGTYFSVGACISFVIRAWKAVFENEGSIPAYIVVSAVGIFLGILFANWFCNRFNH